MLLFIRYQRERGEGVAVAAVGAFTYRPLSWYFLKGKVGPNYGNKSQSLCLVLYVKCVSRNCFEFFFCRWVFFLYWGVR